MIRVEQRAKAILTFLSDYSAKGYRWRKVMPAYVIKSIMARHHSVNFLRELEPETIAFPYGPDVIRDQNGDWRVVEDSGGFIGGMGDLLQNRKTLLKNDGIALLYLSDFENEPDQETRRLAQEFTKLGVEVANYSNPRKKLVTKKKQKIGALILCAPPERNFFGFVSKDEQLDT